MKNKYSQKIVTFGGGTGQFHLLSGFRELNSNEKITAVTGVWDNGGSSGRLRTEIGILPPGDIRRCILALMQDSKQRLVAQKLFDDRLIDMVGPLNGHSFGNLLTARLDNLYGGQDRGIEAESSLFRIKAKIVPVSLSRVNLIAKTKSGNEILGESKIDMRSKDSSYNQKDKITRIYFDSNAEANPNVIKSVKEADKIIFSQGDLYTSVLPHLLVSGVKEAILDSKAKLIFILNLMTKNGETNGYKASDFLKSLNFYLDNPKRLDYMVVNNGSLDREVLDIYKSEGQNLVGVDEVKVRKLNPSLKIIKRPLVTYMKKEHLIRHDPLKLAQCILEI